MPWSKIKNIILFLLLVTNLSLLLFVAVQRVQTSRLRHQAVDSAVRFLQDRGVQVDQALVPRSMQLLPLVVERDLEGEQRSARMFLRGAVEVQALPAEVYRYENENGTVQFHSDGTFSAQLAPGRFPLGEDAESGCLELLSQLGFQGEVISRGEGEAVFLQYWKDTPMFSQQVTAQWDGEGLRALSGGRRLVGQPAPDNSRRTISVATALIGLYNQIAALGDVCGRIDQIVPGYVTAVSQPGAMVLTPVWRVTTDTGTYQLDTVTGQVIRAA